MQMWLSGARLRWKVVLPILMVGISVVLMFVANLQQPRLIAVGSGADVPARVVNSVLNGPGFRMRVPIPTPEVLRNDGDSLPGIAVFWFLIGRAIDRRRARRSLSREHPILALLVFAVLGGVCGLAAIHGFTMVPQMFSYTPWRLELDLFRVRGLLSWGVMDIGLAVWFSALSVYFAWKILVAVSTLRARKRPILAGT